MPACSKCVCGMSTTELVAAEAGHHVGFADRVVDRRGHGLQALIAGLDARACR